MILFQVLKDRRVLNAFIIVWVIILIPFSVAFAASDKKPKPKPLTTDKPNISPEELEYRVQPLTKDDLAVEADGWLQVLKKHVGGVSEVQIQVLTAEDEEKTKLLESVTKLKDQQAALTDHLRVVIDEFKSKGGTIEDYQAYITAISGVEVDVSELLKDFIVNISRKAIFVVGFIVALSMLEVNIGPLLAAIGAAGFNLSMLPVLVFACVTMAQTEAGFSK